MSTLIARSRTSSSAIRISLKSTRMSRVRAFGSSVYKIKYILTTALQKVAMAPANVRSKSSMLAGKHFYIVVWIEYLTNVL
jgi:hypothetical protein